MIFKKLYNKLYKIRSLSKYQSNIGYEIIINMKENNTNFNLEFILKLSHLTKLYCRALLNEYVEIKDF